MKKPRSFTNKQVEVYRALYVNKKIPISQLAQAGHVSYNTTRRMLIGETYKDLNPTTMLPSDSTNTIFLGHGKVARIRRSFIQLRNKFIKETANEFEISKDKVKQILIAQQRNFQ